MNLPFDLLLSIGSFVLTAELLPMVWNKKTAVPLWSSLGTAAVLFPYFAILFWLLGTPVMAITLAFEGLLWWFIVFKRRVKKEEKLIQKIDDLREQAREMMYQ